MRALLAVGLLAVIAATTVVFGEGGSEPAHADHEKPVTAPVPVVDRSWVPSDRGVAVPVAPNADGFKTGIPALASNLITLGRGPLRTPIPVCIEAAQETAYKEATKDAIAAWNVVAEKDEPIFAYAGTETVSVSGVVSATTANCANYDSHAGGRTAGLRSVLVRQARLDEDCPGGLDATVAGCYEPERIRGTQQGGAWVEGTYLGRGEVRLHAAGEGNSLAATIAHELGHALGLSHPYEAIQVGRGNDAGPWKVLGCPDDPGGEHGLKYQHQIPPFRGQTAIPNLSEPARKLLEAITKAEHGGAMMLPSSACKGDRESEGRWSYRNKVALDAYDVSAFSQVYSPAAVTFAADAVRSPVAGKVRVSWTAAHVHAEKGFEVHVKVRSLAPGIDKEWLHVASTAANDVSATFDQPADTTAYRVITSATSHATYRVVSLTDAFGSREPLASAISAEVQHKKAKLKTYELNVTHGNNGDVSPEGKSSRTEGATVTITASPNSGYVVNGWSASDPSAGNARVTLPASCSGTPTPITCSVTMDGPRHVHVTFKVKPAVTPEPTVTPTTTPKPTPTPTPKPEEPTEETKQCLGHTLTVKASGGGRASGGGTYGRKVVGISEDCPTPTASPTASWNSNTHTFEGWSGACSGTTCSVTMDGPKSVTAHFAERTYAFTVTATGTGGSVSGGGTDYKYNAKASASASWNKTSYVFRGWSGACSGTSATCSTTMTSNKSATASFAKRYCYVTARVGTGSGSVSGGGNVHCGVGSATIKASASAGYCFDDWGGGLGQLGQNDVIVPNTCTTDASVTIPKPATAVTVIANFKKEPVTYYTLTVTGGSGSGRYKANTYATASASAGRCFLGTTYTFKRWSGDSTSTSRTVRLYMNRNKAVTAVYTVGGSCQLSEESVEGDDGGGPAWTEAPTTEPADDP